MCICVVLELNRKIVTELLCNPATYSKEPNITEGLSTIFVLRTIVLT